MKFAPVLISLAPIALLAACGEPQQSESSDDFAARINGGDVGPGGAGAGQAPAAGGPAVAANGREALALTSDYSRTNEDGTTNSLRLLDNDSYVLVEKGVEYQGSYEWLPDGKRIRLNGASSLPIVVVANGALYRVANENVPLDDLVPDRMYALCTGEQLSAE